MEKHTTVYMFKPLGKYLQLSWLGETPIIPCFGDGRNVVPTIHITDLAA